MHSEGLLLAIEFTAPLVKVFCKKLKEEGLLAKDTHDVTVRFAPPLIITQDQIDEAFSRIEAAISQLP